MIACDIDGTLLDYDYIPGAKPQINLALLSTLAGSKIALVSNQGGLPFGWLNRNRQPDAKAPRPYPKPADFVLRLRALVDACAEHDITIKEVHICVSHPRAMERDIDDVADVLNAELDAADFAFPYRVYITNAYRKPQPGMLWAVKATTYYGDSDEDEQSAQAAGIEFVKVPRFMGKAMTV